MRPSFGRVRLDETCFVYVPNICLCLIVFWEYFTGMIICLCVRMSQPPVYFFVSNSTFFDVFSFCFCLHPIYADEVKKRNSMLRFTSLRHKQITVIFVVVVVIVDRGQHSNCSNADVLSDLRTLPLVSPQQSRSIDI